MATTTEAPQRFGLPERAITRLRETLRTFPIEQAILYGSRAMGTHRRGSDIDLTLIAPTMTSGQLLQLEQQIDDLLLPWKVGLSLFHEIDNPALREHIQRIGVPLDCPAGTQ